jgi:hypothetical protein
MSTQIRPAPHEHPVLIASPERALDGSGERNLLVASSEGPNRVRSVVPERRNEQGLLAERPSR